jgi:hypothetical protein
VITMPLSVLLLWPLIIEREWPWLAVALGAYCLPTLIGALKFGQPPSYHTWGAKLSAVAVGCSLVPLFLDISPWPFRLCIPLLVLEAGEEIAMTLVLPRWQANVPTLWHALRLRAAEQKKEAQR